MSIVKRKKAIEKGCTLYDSKQMAFWKRQNYKNGRKKQQHLSVVSRGYELQKER